MLKYRATLLITGTMLVLSLQEYKEQANVAQANVLANTVAVVTPKMVKQAEAMCRNYTEQIDKAYRDAGEYTKNNSGQSSNPYLPKTSLFTTQMFFCNQAMHYRQQLIQQNLSRQY